MRYFAEKISKSWEQNNTIYNEYYFKKMIALAIIFKTTENIVTSQQWYKEIKAYRANIVTYSIAIIFNEIKKRNINKTIDFKSIWNNQKINSILERQLIVTTKEAFDFITRDDRLTLNVTEWCKKELCWERAQNTSFTLNEEFIDNLIDISEENQEQSDAKKDRKTENQLNYEIEVVKLGTKY